MTQQPTRSANDAAGWYRGDCHVHSVHSHGGELTAEQLAAGARAAGLDFVATTEHNNARGHAAWTELGDCGLTILFGQEVVTHTGHWLALGLEAGQVIDGDYGVRDGIIEQHLAEVHRAGGLCVAAHPYAPYPAGIFMYPYQGFDLVEVWNGSWTSDVPWQADNEAALAEWGRTLATDVDRGRWRPAVGNSDVHLAGQLGVPHTVVAAEELTAPAILAGIRAGHCWIAESAQVHLAFSATAAGRRAGIGEQLETDDAEVVARVRVRGVPGGAVTFHTERGVAHRAVLPSAAAGVGAGAGAAEIEWRTSARESGFVRIEVRYGPERRMAALSNPIILR